MNRELVNKGRLMGLLMAVAFILAAAGCATQRVDWQGRIGTYTYDQAITDLGPPEKSANLTDGTVVADWLTQRGGVLINNYYPYGPGMIAPIGPTVTAVSAPNYYLRLTFDPKGRLKAWKRFTR